MTMTAIPRLALAGDRYVIASSTALNGADEQVGHCGYWTTPDGATRHIEKIVWATNAVTAGDDIICTIESIDAATGFPAGIIAAGRTGTQTVANGDDYATFETELGTHYDLTSGTWLAITFKMSNAAKDMTIAKGAVSLDVRHVANWICEDILGVATWVKGTYGSCVALKCSTGEYLIPLGGSTGLLSASDSINTGSNPRYAGNKIVCKVDARLVGFSLNILDMDYGMTIKLVDADGTTIVGDDAATNMSVTIDADYRSGITSYLGSLVNFPCPKTLTAGTAYYLIFSPETADSVSIPRVTHFSEALKHQAAGIPSGWSMTAVTSPSAISWTETTTRFYALFPVFDQIAMPAVGNVTEDDSVNGATGTYHEATVAEVQDGVFFGAASALEGTYAGGGGGGAINLDKMGAM